MNVNRCVCCGAIIPEGRMICPICEQEEVITDNTNITESIWKELSTVLFKYALPYTTSYSTRNIGQIEVIDKHIQINLTIPDYYGDTRDDNERKISK